MTPPAEVHIDDALVRDLLRSQHPDLADLPLSFVAAGWDNVIVRLGDALAARLPRRALGASLVANEQRWLPQLAPLLPLSIPAPIRTGTPDLRYPWAWSIVSWFEGDTATRASLRGSDARLAAITLGRFLRALHRPAPTDAPANLYRGIPLADRRRFTDEHIEVLGPALTSRYRTLIERFDALSASPPWDGPSVWLHGDLHPDNIVVRDKRIVAVLDFGDLCAGDPATDLAVGWMLFDESARDVLLAEAGADRSTAQRANAWAIALALAYLAGGTDDPWCQQIGHTTLRSALA